jgi:long-chain acyl-CoA synthetase
VTTVSRSAPTARLEEAPTGSGAETLPTRLLDRAGHRPHAIAWRVKRSGEWVETPWSTVLERVASLALALDGDGVGAGDGVALVGGDSPDGVLVDLAAQVLGACSVTTLARTRDELVAALAEARAKVAYCDDPELLEELVAAAERLPDLALAIVPNESFVVEAAVKVESLETVEARRPAPVGSPAEELRRLVGRTRGSDTAFVGFSAGTSGAPEPVAFSQQDVVAAASALVEALGLGPRDRVLRHLPLWHPVGRIAGVYAPLLAGASLTFPAGRTTLLRDMVERSPTVVVTTPRLAEVLMSRHEVRTAASGRLRRSVTRAAFSLLQSTAGRRLGWLIAGRAVRNHLGLRRTRTIACFGEGVADDLVRFYRSLGVSLRELYGRAEDGIVCCPRGREELATAGRPLPGVEVRIESDGELSVRVPWRSGGAHGWEGTGDCASRDERSLIRIHGRSSSRDAGATAFPEEAEKLLRATPYVSRAVAVAGEHGSPGVLVELDASTVVAWAQRAGIPFSSYEALSEHSDVADLIAAEIRRAGLVASRFRILPRELQVDRGELTPLGTIRRETVLAHFTPLVQALREEE